MNYPLGSKKRSWCDDMFLDAVSDNIFQFFNFRMNNTGIIKHYDRPMLYVMQPSLTGHKPKNNTHTHNNVAYKKRDI